MPLPPLKIKKPESPPTTPTIDVTYTSPPPSPSNIIVKKLHITRIISASILKDLNTKFPDDVKTYLVPLLSQTVEQSTKFNEQTDSNIKILEIVQTFPMIGSDLTQIHDETYYRTNRDTIIRTLFEAVNFLHSKKILHRDIKPDNIVWDGKRARLIDFDNIVRIGSPRNNFGGTIPRNNSTEFTQGYDIYCANLTIQALDFCLLTQEEVIAFWPGGINEYVKTKCTKAGGAASARSTRLTKRHRPKKNGRLRASQSRRRNCTRHVAR